MSEHTQRIIIQISNLDDKNVLWVWGVVCGMDITTKLVDCNITHLLLILHYKYGDGGRI